VNCCKEEGEIQNTGSWEKRNRCFFHAEGVALNRTRKRKKKDKYDAQKKGRKTDKSGEEGGLLL